MPDLDSIELECRNCSLTLTWGELKDRVDAADDEPIGMVICPKCGHAKFDRTHETNHA